MADADADGPNLFEKGMRKVTGDDSYRFGDLTKKGIENLSGKDLDEYQFGDITKRLANEAEQKAKQKVLEYTGRDDYEFGDLTKKFLQDADANLQKTRDKVFEDLPGVMWESFFGKMDKEQRQELLIALLEWIVYWLLGFILLSVAATSATIVTAWLISSVRTGVAPLAAGQWGSFLGAHTTLRLFLDPVAGARVGTPFASS